jgi:hypothetical protein
MLGSQPHRSTPPTAELRNGDDAFVDRTTETHPYPEAYAGRDPRRPDYSSMPLTAPGRASRRAAVRRIGRLSAADSITPARPAAWSTSDLLIPHIHICRLKCCRNHALDERFESDIAGPHPSPRAMTSTIDILDYIEATAAHHARLLAPERKVGKPRDVRDLIIASHAIETDRSILRRHTAARPGVPSEVNGLDEFEKADDGRLRLARSAAVRDDSPHWAVLCLLANAT